VKTRFVAFILSLFVLSLKICAQPALPAGAEALFQKAMSQINQRHVSWVQTAAKTVTEKKLNEAEIKDMAAQYGVLGSLNTLDIEAIIFFVLMQAVKSEQEELRAMLSKMKDINDQKKAIREALARLEEKKKPVTWVQLDSFMLLVNDQPFPQQVNPANTVQPERTTSIDTSKKPRTNSPVTKAEIDKVKEQLKSKLDSLRELGEKESMRIQALLDRMTTMINWLSNILKKISKAQNSIIQNLK
jgi:hypothetical protein